MNKFYLLIALFLVLTSCRSQNIENNQITIPDDFSNKSYTQEYDTYLNSIATEKQLKTVKVLYNDKVYDFKRFKDKIGFNELSDVSIVKDSTKLSQYQIKNCKVLIIVKKK